jgi:hypothetical protein
MQAGLQRERLRVFSEYLLANLHQMHLVDDAVTNAPSHAKWLCDNAAVGHEVQFDPLQERNIITQQPSLRSKD